MSYFEHYFNPRGKKTLRAYSRPVSLDSFNGLPWRTTEEDLWVVAERLVELPHYSVLPAHAERNLTRTDRRLFEAGHLGSVR
jgi:hypothetical protein